MKILETVGDLVDFLQEFDRTMPIRGDGKQAWLITEQNFKVTRSSLIALKGGERDYLEISL